MKKITNIFLIILFSISFSFSQKSQKGIFALTNATIETVTNGTIQGTLLIKDGKIAAVGSSVSIPANATVIDCKDHFIYPGMMDSGTRLGLSEVGSISVTQDYNEIGDIIPHMDALSAVNPNSVAIPVTRVSGVTTVLVAPAGGRFSGTASLINLIGYTPDQMYAGFKGVVLNYPSSGGRSRKSEEDRKKEEEKSLKTLNEVWKNVLLYSKIDSAVQKNPKIKPEYNPPMAALLPVVKGEIPLLIEVNREKDILSAIEWVQKRKVKAIFTGVSEGWRVGKQIAEAEIPVITGPVLRIPSRASDRFDKAYANAGLMHKAGVKVAIRTGESENVRNLPFHAGFAAAYGMGKDAALKAVTIIPAEIFGVDNQIGSIETGKIASLFVSDGDPFETKTQIKHLFINGWKVSLESRHTRLYNEFLERKPGLKK
ncbi:MAG: amidohydrolase family protein [Bacteroidetes bacterium]|nr:amidohydrolase family protein [Bacteroidota bacterium]